MPHPTHLSLSPFELNRTQPATLIPPSCYANLSCEMPLQRPSAFFRDPAEALSRVSPNRAKMYIRCFMAEVAKLVDNHPGLGLSIEDVDEAVLMLDIVESVEPPTR